MPASYSVRAGAEDHQLGLPLQQPIKIAGGQRIETADRPCLNFALRHQHDGGVVALRIHLDPAVAVRGDGVEVGVAIGMKLHC